MKTTVIVFGILLLIGLAIFWIADGIEYDKTVNEDIGVIYESQQRGF